MMTDKQGLIIKFIGYKHDKNRIVLDVYDATGKRLMPNGEPLIELSAGEQVTVTVGDGGNRIDVTS